MSIYVPGKVVLRQEYIGTDDPDAAVYIAAVEAADEAASPGVGALETGVKVAIHSFVKGCKADGIWPALKASCILAGARTLDGCLVPLVGSAPTNVNFVDGDYNRETGLVGDGSTKYLDSNRNNNADPQNSNHNAVYVSTAQTTVIGQYIGTGSLDAGRNNLGHNPLVPESFARSRVANSVNLPGIAIGFFGHARSNGSTFVLRGNGTNLTANETSTTPENATLNVFRRGTINYTNARLSFYSIGQAIDLALLDARVTALINAIAAAIP